MLKKTKSLWKDIWHQKSSCYGNAIHFNQVTDIFSLIAACGNHFYVNLEVKRDLNNFLFKLKF